MNDAFDLIKEYYGMQRAKRSNELLINHIEEGLLILQKLKANQVTQDAYCLHPILQSDNDFNTNKGNDFKNIKTESIILAMEYRRVANSYLSFDKVEDFVGFSCYEIKQMLIADKIQNYKDFMIHHYGSHDRREELYQYFNNWFMLLNINYNDFV